MGILRVYLALCVIVAHSGAVFPWQMHDGRQAVQIFFMLSGFYMAMVLSSSRYATAQDFYASRFMRIFPPYWITLAGTFVLSVASGLIFGQWLLLSTYYSDPLACNGAAGFWLAFVSNLTLIGQDWIMFARHDLGGSIQFTSNFWKDACPLWRYMLLPQCWSVGLELIFYALAPCLNRLRSRWLALIALAALAARLLTYWGMGTAHDPWTLRFFPFEISLFLLGMLGYRLYTRTAPYHPPARFRCVSRLSYLGGGIALLFLLYIHVRTVAYVSRFVGNETGVLISYPFWALGIPVLFFAFGNQKDDRMIGELSYPVYLVHYVVIVVVTILLTPFGVGRGIGAVSALVSIIVAAIFYRTIIAPLDRTRHILTRTGSAGR